MLVQDLVAVGQESGQYDQTVKMWDVPFRQEAG